MTEETETEHAAGDKPTVIEALSAVMADVQHVSKEGRNTTQNYNFRGVDAVVNAVGPALRTHGVVVVPTRVEYDVERYTTRNGAEMKGVTTIIDFRFYGPAGDYIDAQAAGESSDAGDKAMPKAHSVTYRTLLLQALCIPTDDPDPDETAHERSATAQRTEGRRQSPPPAERKLVDKNGIEIKLPRGWRELAEAFDHEFVDPEWLSEAVVKKFGAERRELDEEKQSQAGVMLREMYIALMQILGPVVGEIGYKRAELRKAFAQALDGLELEGPPWRIHPLDFDPDEEKYEPRVPSDDPDILNLELSDSAEDIPFGDDDAPMGDHPPDEEPPDGGYGG